MEGEWKGNGREGGSVNPSLFGREAEASPTHPLVTLFRRLLLRLLDPGPAEALRAPGSPPRPSGVGLCATAAGGFKHRLGASECSPAAAVNNCKGVHAAVLAQLNLCTYLGVAI